MKNFESQKISFVRGLPLSQVQSASENGSIFFLPACSPSAEVVANVAAGARATAGGAAAAAAETEFVEDDEDDSVAAMSAEPLFAVDGAAAATVSCAREVLSSASSWSMRLRIASSSSSIWVEVRDAAVSEEDVEGFADGWFVKEFWVMGGVAAD